MRAGMKSIEALRPTFPQCSRLPCTTFRQIRRPRTRFGSTSEWLPKTTTSATTSNSRFSIQEARLAPLMRDKEHQSRFSVYIARAFYFSEGVGVRIGRRPNKKTLTCTPPSPASAVHHLPSGEQYWCSVPTPSVPSRNPATASRNMHNSRNERFHIFESMAGPL